MKKACRQFFLPFTLLFYISFYSPAEPLVVITPPTLNGEGNDSLQAMLNAACADFTGELANLASESLDKPLFMEGFVNAAARTLLVPGAVPGNGKMTLSVGSTVAVYSEDLSPTMIERLGELDTESDERTGACTQPITISFEMPLDMISPRLRAGVSGGWIKAETTEYGLEAWTVGGGASWRVFPARSGMAAWDGLDVSFGADYGKNKITALVQPGRMTQTVTIDIDDDGPLVGIDTILSMEPDILGGVETGAFSFRFRASTGATFFRALGLSAGAGWMAARGSSAVAIDTDAPIEVEGTLGGMIEENGSIVITGTTSKRDFFTQAFFLQSALSFEVGSFRLSIPVIWTPADGVGAGAFAGVSF